MLEESLTVLLPVPAILEVCLFTNKPHLFSHTHPMSVAEAINPVLDFPDLRPLPSRGHALRLRPLSPGAALHEPYRCPRRKIGELEVLPFLEEVHGTLGLRATVQGSGLGLSAHLKLCAEGTTRNTAT